MARLCNNDNNNNDNKNNVEQKLERSKLIMSEIA